jgi:hypothetical protein
MRRSAKGQFKYSVGNLFYSFGKMNMKLGRRIAETKKERKLREAHNVITRYNSMLFFAYFRDFYNYDKDRTIKFLRERIDINQVKSALDILELSYTYWEQVASKLYYWGIIVKLSRYKIEHKQYIEYTRNSKENRLHCINSDKLIKEALDYFNISEYDWIEYGDAVISMNDIDFANDIRHIADLNQFNMWGSNDSIELIQYRDYKSNDYKDWKTLR